jgi:hypothetical protein
MSRPTISGIVGLVAVAICVFGFTQNWIEYKEAYVLVEYATGIDILGASTEHGLMGACAVMILIGIAGGVVNSIFCFIKEGEAMRVFFFLVFFAVFLGSVLATEHIGGMPYAHGTGYFVGIGVWMEMIASMLLFAAMICPEKRSD